MKLFNFRKPTKCTGSKYDLNPYCTVFSLIKLNATVTSQLSAGTAQLTAKHYKIFQILALPGITYAILAAETLNGNNRQMFVMP
jgi:hypothetical protein